MAAPMATPTAPPAAAGLAVERYQKAGGRQHSQKGCGGAEKTTTARRQGEGLTRMPVTGGPSQSKADRAGRRSARLAGGPFGVSPNA